MGYIGLRYIELSISSPICNSSGALVAVATIVMSGIAGMNGWQLAAIVLGVRISKAQRLSNWEAKQLTPAQQLYAATDAWIGREIYLKLEK